MAVVYNAPDGTNDTAAPAPNGTTQQRPDATPTSKPGGVQYVAPTYVTKANGDVAVKGSAENDRLSTKDLLADSDHVIATGAGDDVFIFRQDDATNPALRNAVVDLGAGDKDQVVLANTLQDYQVTIRENGSVKFEYIGDGDGSAHTAAITFQGAELFTFRNIDHTSAGEVYYKSVTYDLAGLKAAYAGSAEM